MSRGYFTKACKRMRDNSLIMSQNALTLAQVPEQTLQVEAAAKAAMAWARETDDYKMMVDAARLWILARRKTTSLVKPYIRKGQNGREGNNDVAFLADFGFTKSQWDRRCEELDVPDEAIEDYFDMCISKQWEPSKFGMLKHANGGGIEGKDFVERLGAMLNKIIKGDFTHEQINAARELLAAFEVTNV